MWILLSAGPYNAAGSCPSCASRRGHCLVQQLWHTRAAHSRARLGMERVVWVEMGCKSEVLCQGQGAGVSMHCGWPCVGAVELRGQRTGGVPLGGCQALWDVQRTRRTNGLSTVPGGWLQVPGRWAAGARQPLAPPGCSLAPPAGLLGRCRLGRCLGLAGGARLFGGRGGPLGGGGLLGGWGLAGSGQLFGGGVLRGMRDGDQTRVVGRLRRGQCVALHSGEASNARPPWLRPWPCPWRGLPPWPCPWRGWSASRHG